MHQHQLTDKEYTAAALIEVIGHLADASMDYADRGEAEPEWLGAVIGLIKGVFERSIPEIPWEEAVLASKAFK